MGKMYEVINGKYSGRKGIIETFPHTSNIMFYPIEGCYPYRVCLRKEDVKEI